jgi:PilZ domain-containing protein
VIATSYRRMNEKLILMTKVCNSRRSQRFPIRMPLRFRVSGDGEWRQGRTVNVSSAGVFFRCQLSADCGTRVEMNFILPSSLAKDSGLEVACKGEVVRLEQVAGAEGQPSIAVKFSDYRLFPLVPGRTNLQDPFGAAKAEE